MLIAAAPPTALTITLASALVLAAAVLAVVDSALRFRKPGGNALLAILALVLGLLLFVAGFEPVQRWVSTSIPVLPLAVATAVVLLVELIAKSARKAGVLWLTILAALACGAAAAVTYLHIR